ncbi:MAG: ribosome hibernation-promoting factor, HPF/YfiA family, partial [Trebonia sp.]
LRVDVEVSTERNPRQADRSERVELTIRSRGPAIRAEAAADDRYAALDLAFAKLEGRLRKAAERRKVRRGDLTVRSTDVLTAVTAATDKVGGRPSGHRRPEAVVPLPAFPEDGDGPAGRDLDGSRDEAGAEESASGVLPMQMVGDGPLIVREKFHASQPMTIDDALLEMELVGHDFFAYHDSQCGKFSVVYRRRGYDYGVIRLVGE